MAYVTRLVRMTREALEGGQLDYVQMLDELASGKSLSAVCREMVLSQATVLNWIMEDREREVAYERALRVKGEVLAHETLDIVDGVMEREDVPGAKLRVEQRMRVARAWNQKYREGVGMTFNVGGSLLTLLSSMGEGVGEGVGAGQETEVIEGGGEVEDAEEVTPTVPVLPEAVPVQEVIAPQREYAPEYAPEYEEI